MREMLYLDRDTHTHTHTHTHRTNGTLGGGHGALQTLHRAALSSLKTGHAATPRSGGHGYTPEPGSMRGGHPPV